MDVVVRLFSSQITHVFYIPSKGNILDGVTQKHFSLLKIWDLLKDFKYSSVSAGWTHNDLTLTKQNDAQDIE